MKRLKAVKHPRVWLVGAISCCVVAMTSAVGVGFIPVDDRWRIRLLLNWGLFIPICAAGGWMLGVWGRSYERAKRIERRHCPYCDYDLRATPRQCPECGQVPAGR